jgi:hypothetical protein
MEFFTAHTLGLCGRAHGRVHIFSMPGRNNAESRLDFCRFASQAKN